MAHSDATPAHTPIGRVLGHRARARRGRGRHRARLLVAGGHRRAEGPAHRDRRPRRGGRRRRGRRRRAVAGRHRVRRGRRSRRRRRGDRDPRGLRRDRARPGARGAHLVGIEPRRAAAAHRRRHPAEEGVNAQAAAAAEAAGAPAAPPHIEVPSPTSCRSPTPTRAAPDSPPPSSRSCSAACSAASRSRSPSSARCAGCSRWSSTRWSADSRCGHPAGLVRLAAGRLLAELGRHRPRARRDRRADHGFVALMGRAGIALGPVIMLLFANPISAAAIPKEFIPRRGATSGSGSRRAPRPRSCASCRTSRGRHHVPVARAGRVGGRRHRALAHRPLPCGRRRRARCRGGARRRPRRGVAVDPARGGAQSASSLRPCRMPLTAATTAKTTATTGWPRVHQPSAAAENTAISTSALPNVSTRNTAFGDTNSAHAGSRAAARRCR